MLGYIRDRILEDATLQSV